MGVRDWVSEWGDTAQLCISLTGIVGLGLTAWALVLQIEDSKESEQKTQVQLETLTGVLNELKAQNNAMILANVQNTFDQFWKARADEAADRYIEAFEKVAGGGREEFPDREAEDMDAAWQVLFDCDVNPVCDVGAVVTKEMDGKTICAIADDRSFRLEKLFEEIGEIDVETGSRLIKASVLGRATCWCPEEEPILGSGDYCPIEVSQ